MRSSGSMRRDGPRKLWAALRAAARVIAGPTLPLFTVLRFCQACGRDRLVVLERSSYGDGLGVVLVRCADCGARRYVVASCQEIDALVALHSAQRQAMADELESSDPARLSAEIAALLGDT